MSAGSGRKIGFIGAGKMATALAKGLGRQFAAPENILASDPYPSARQAFTRETGCPSVEDNAAVAAHAEILILAVKPQSMAKVLSELAPLLRNQPLAISIAAGVTLATLHKHLGNSARLVRVMPNTPCLIGAGASGFALGPGTAAADGPLVEELLTTVGLAVEVAEPLLDVVTGLSGSGPAYVYQIIEALSDGGVLMGLPRPVATKLAAQTLLGAARMALTTGQHPGQLKDDVTSPGGTTIAGLHAMEQGGCRAILMNAVQAATERSRELGKPS